MSFTVPNSSSLGVPNTPLNRALAAAMVRRLRSDAGVASASAMLLRLLGAGAFCLLLGAGVGAAFLGYSYITDSRTSLEKLTTAVADALSRVVLKVGDVNVKGSVPLDTSSASVRLDSRGASVPLDASSASVRLDSKGATATLEASGGREVPSREKLNGLNGPDPQSRIVRDLTLFNSRKLTEGQVVTGWHYSGSDEDVPDFQYCYYQTNSVEGASRKFDIAKNREPLPSPKDLPIDIQEALENCVWFRGATR